MAQIFSNQARINYNGQTVESNIVYGAVINNIVITKHAVYDHYVKGSRLSYVISIVNNEAEEVSLTLTDNLGRFDDGGTDRYPLTYVPGTLVYYLDGVEQTVRPTVTAGPPLTITGVNIPSGSNATLAYGARVNEYAPLDVTGRIDNTVTAQVEDMVPMTATETVRTLDQPILTISKAISPVPVLENGRLTYTFTIENTGNVPVIPLTGAVINDTFDPVLTDLSVTFNGMPWNGIVNYEYSEETGVFATRPGQVFVPAATYTRTDGVVQVNPGVSTLVITGTV